MTPTDFYGILLPICMRYQGSITGGYRSAKRNELVGGHPNSRHLLGLAFDVVLDNMSLAHDFADECRRQGMKALLEDIGEVNEHIHVQVP